MKRFTASVWCTASAAFFSSSSFLPTTHSYAYRSSSVRSSSSFLGRALTRRSRTSSRSSISSTTTTMLLSKFFGGGAFEADRVQYDQLDPPGPELGRWANAGVVPAVSDNLHLATFAGGCFWGLELAFQRQVGVHRTAVGYTQGREPHPTYNQVCAEATGHTEAVLVYYHPDECSYADLLACFLSRVDPTTVNGQGRDFGKQYRTGIYFHTPEQEKQARDCLAQEAPKYKKPIATEVLPAMPFWPAEKYHQQYLAKGGRFGMPQDASKGATETIRCYG